MADLVRLSKFMSLMLRHKAADFGLSLDENGFTDIDTVWEQITLKYGTQYTRADLDALLSQTEAGKQRYERVGTRIRALYGHSGVREIKYEAVQPPEILYHGTTPEALKSIREEGLTAQQRQYVHLSTHTERAVNVAGRHGKAIILNVRAKDAHDAGLEFYHPEPQHYLVKAVPIAFIDFPE
ncbi:MAG: RNA 2'-phosphotransferase [Aggregatilineales bacterium]